MKRVVSGRKRPIFHRGTIILLLRLCLGGLFIYASLNKILNTAHFKEAVANYEILPYWIINMTAVVLPWLELWTGTLLIAGVFVRACAIVYSSLLLLFNIAIGLNFARGVEFYCGCFGEESIISSMNYWHIIFNMFWLSMAAVLFILERRRFSHRSSSKSVIKRQREEL